MRYKFRAWDIYKKQMIQAKGIKQYPSGDWSIWDGETEILPCNIILMQFTGLTDRNGKEIWEGDILASSHTANQVVEYEHDRFILKPDNYDLWKVCEYWEVIGSLYEHPELLR